MSEFSNWLLKPWAVGWIDVIGGITFYPIALIAFLFQDIKMIIAAILIYILNLFFFFSKKTNANHDE